MIANKTFYDLIFYAYDSLSKNDFNDYFLSTILDFIDVKNRTIELDNNEIQILKVIKKFEDKLDDIKKHITRAD